MPRRGNLYEKRRDKPAELWKKLKRAIDSGESSVLEEAVAEAEACGLGQTQRARKAREDMHRLLQERPRHCAAPAEHPSPRRVPASTWDRRVPPSYCITPRMKALWLLGLSTTHNSSPSPEDVRAAYERAAMDTHPDKMHNHGRKQEATELFKRVKHASELLTSSESRRYTHVHVCTNVYCPSG